MSLPFLEKKQDDGSAVAWRGKAKMLADLVDRAMAAKKLNAKTADAVVRAILKRRGPNTPRVQKVVAAFERLVKALKELENEQ